MGLCIQCDRCGKIIDLNKVVTKSAITKVTIEPYISAGFGTTVTTAYLCKQCSSHIMKELGGNNSEY